MKNNSILLFLSLFSLGCNQSNKLTVPSSNDKKITHSITLKSNIQKDAAIKEIFLTYQDKFDTDIDLYSNLGVGNLTDTISSESPVFIKDTSPSSAEYLLMQGDEINIEQYQKSNRILIFKTRDTIRNNELLFFIALKEAGKSFPSANLIRDSIKTADIKLSDPLLKESFMLMKREKLIEKSPVLAYNYYSMQYNESLNFLNNYKREHPVSTALSDLFKKYLYYNYCTKVIAIVLFEYKETGVISPVLARKMEEFSKAFNEDKLAFMPAYRSAAFSYARYLSLVENGRNDNVRTLFETVNSNFKGYTKDYLLFKIINTSITLNNKPDTGLIKHYFTVASYQPYIERIKATNEANATISTTDTELEDISGKKTNLKQFIAENKGKVIYIDFWASWCLPCVREMPYSEKLKEAFKAKPVRFVYFSFDEKKFDWLSSNAVNKDANSFLVTGDFKSMLAKQLKVKSIPRYIIVNKKGEIINTDAKRPSDPDLPAELNKYILQKE